MCVSLCLEQRESLVRSGQAGKDEKYINTYSRKEEWGNKKGFTKIREEESRYERSKIRSDVEKVVIGTKDEFSLRKGCVSKCVCVTIEKKSNTGQPLHWSDEQLHECLSATFWLGLVDLSHSIT